MQKTKLLFILGSYFPAQSGGPNNTIHWQAKYLAKSGIDVTVASFKTGLQPTNISDYNIIFNNKTNVEGVKAYYFNYFKNRYLSFRFYIWILKNIKNFNFVQLTSYFFPITWISALLCRVYNIPFAIAPRGELEDNAIKYSHGLKILLHKVFLSKLYKKACFILVTSQQEKEFSQQYFSDQTVFKLVPNYIDLSGKTSLNEQQILKKKDILYLGRLHPKKGIENLIKAYQTLDDTVTEQHKLLIAGSGDNRYELSLKELAWNDHRFKHKIIFLGHIQGKKKETLYQQSKIFALPSYSENFGNVVLEALSFNTPVIASKYTPWEALLNQECGMHVNNTPQDLALAISQFLMMNNNEYLHIAQNAYHFVYTNYDIQENIGILLRIYPETNNHKKDLI